MILQMFFSISFLKILYVKKFQRCYLEKYAIST